MLYTWFTDLFNEADGPLSSDWSSQGVNGARILNQQCTSNGIGFTSYIGSLAGQIPADQWASFKIATLSYDSGTGFGASLSVDLRANNVLSNGYGLFVTRNSDGTTQL